MTEQYSLEMMAITDLHRVGSRIAALLEKLSISNVRDLLFHLPFRYEDRTRIYTLQEIRPNDHVTVEGEILSGQLNYGKRRSLICKLTDHKSVITLRFFYFNANQVKQLTKPGLKLRCFGEVRLGYQGLEMVHPEYRVMLAQEPLPLPEQLTPIYPTTKGIAQRTLTHLIDQALAKLSQNPQLLPELLPDLPDNMAKISIQAALHYVHRPPVNAPIALLLNGQHPMQQRLALEELVAHQLGLQQFRFKIKTHKALSLISHEANDSVQQQLIERLPYVLTQAQQKVIDEINQDIKNEKPMLRLLQGDVGSGKTIVAALAACQAVQAGFQAVIMSPTEILAEQHLRNFKNWLAPLGVNVGWLVGAINIRERRNHLAKIASGEYQIVIGTHALFQKDVNYAKLALVIIDEQHRFGVHQRLTLKEKATQNGLCPHQLIMTATPIPRSLAMSAYADLDLSVIDELPPGRKKINTVLIGDERRATVIERVRVNCLKGHQAYWVCTLIEDSEVLQAQAAEVIFAELKKLLPDLKIGLVHGRLKVSEKESIMRDYQKGEIQLLVATTVIEVGVDVPNASLMIIENAERLGLAQLHQLRGRVGRGNAKSFCVLLYKAPLTNTAYKRLHIMRNHSDGFLIAQQDLQIRGPGDVLGTRQTGLLTLRIADIVRDEHLIPFAQQLSRQLIAKKDKAVDQLLARWVQQAEHYVGV